MRPSHSVLMVNSLPLPTAAGVVVPKAGAIVPLHEPTSNRPTGVGGFWEFLAPVLGAVTGGLFGSSSEKRQIEAAQAMTQAQLDAQVAALKLQSDAALEAARLESRSAIDIANLQAASQDRTVDAAVATARIQAENELQAIGTAYNSQLTAQRLQKAVAEEQLSTQLLAQTQSGIFSLANTGLIQAGDVSTAYPKAGTTAISVMIGVTVLGLAWAFRPKPSARKKKKGWYGKKQYQQQDYSAPAYSGEGY